MTGMTAKVAILAVLITIQAVMIIIQARSLAVAVVALWELKPPTTIAVPTGIFAVSFLARHLLTVWQNRTFFSRLLKRQLVKCAKI